MAKFRLFTVPLLIGLLAAQTVAIDRKAAERALLSLENEWLGADYDAGPLQHILADDFIHVLPDGFISKAQILDYMRNLKQKPQFGPRHFENLRVRIYANTLIVTGDVVETRKDGPGIVRRTRFTDVFVFRDNYWQAVNAQELPLTKK